MKAMVKQRSHSIEFKRQVVAEHIAGESLYGLAKRHDLSRQLIRVWIEKYEAGGLDEDAQAADLLHEYETYYSEVFLACGCARTLCASVNLRKKRASAVVTKYS